MFKINRFHRITIGVVLIGLLCVLWVWSKKRTMVEVDFQTANTQQLMVSGLSTLRASGGRDDEKMLSGLLTLIRAAIDVEVYPPTQPRNPQPIGLIGGSIMASVLAIGHQEPKRLDRWIDALEKWSPKFPNDYSPGWEYKRILPQGERSKIVSKYKASVLDKLRRIRRTACTPDEAKLANEINELRQVREQTGEEQTLAERYNDHLRTAQLTSRKSELDTALKQRQMKYADLRFRRLTFARWHAAAELDARDYFDDPLVVWLCQAIEADDVAAMTKAIDDGADINALGKHGVTPLFWSLPDNRLNRFELLILRGADPTVQIDSNWLKDLPTFTGAFNVSNLSAERKTLLSDYRRRYGISDFVKRNEASVLGLTICLPHLAKHLQLIADAHPEPDKIDQNAMAEPIQSLAKQFNGMSPQILESLLKLGLNPDVQWQEQYRSEKIKNNTLLLNRASNRDWDSAEQLLRAGADVSLGGAELRQRFFESILREHQKLADRKSNLDFSESKIDQFESLFNWLHENTDLPLPKKLWPSFQSLEGLVDPRFEHHQAEVPITTVQDSNAADLLCGTITDLESGEPIVGAKVVLLYGVPLGRWSRISLGAKPSPGAETRHVVWEEGAFVSAARPISSIDGLRLFETTTNRNGEYSLATTPDLRTKHKVFEVFAPGYQRATGLISHGSGMGMFRHDHPRDGDISYAMLKSKYFAGEVVDSEGNPLAGVTILAQASWPARGYSFERTTTDDAGHFEIFNCPKSAEQIQISPRYVWSLEFQKPGYQVNDVGYLRDMAIAQRTKLKVVLTTPDEFSQ